VINSRMVGQQACEGRRVIVETRCRRTQIAKLPVGYSPSIRASQEEPDWPPPRTIPSDGTDSLRETLKLLVVSVVQRRNVLSLSSTELE